jgi:predicted permease
MKAFGRLRSWLRFARRRDELDRDLQDEMQLHIDLYEADLRARGLTPEQAHRRARASFGSVEAKKDEARQALGLRLIDELRADTGYALRLLRRSPGFTAVAILSLALGIGANTAIFSLIDTVLLKKLPVVQDPDSLFFVDNSGGKSGGNSGPPYPCFELLRDRNTTMSGLAAFDEARLKVTIDGTAEEMRGQYVSGTFYDVLGVRAMHGRLLTPSDDASVVISHGLWRRRFAMRPDVLGRTIQVGRHAVTIVGITPPEFFGLQVGSLADLTVPIALSENNLRARSLWWFSVIGRLKPGVPVSQARAELHTLWDGYMNEIGQPREKRNYFSGIELVPAARGVGALRRQLSEPLVIIMMIVGLVLFVGCANVANLLLARASARHTELSVRLAIGASRGRLIRQLLTEGVVLSALGTIAGLIFAQWGVSFLVGVLARAEDGRVLTTTFDARLVAFAAAIGALAGVLFSLAPAIRATRVDAPKPSAAGATVGGGRLGQALVAIQVVLSIVLLSGAALFVRTLQNLHAVDSGFDADGVIVMPVETTMPRVLTGGVPPAEVAAHHRMLGAAWQSTIEQVRSIPGVAAAAVATMSPLAGNDRGVLIAVSGGPALSEERRNIHINHITPGFFETLRIPLVAGRVFTDDDRAGRRVAILNRTAAREYFGDENPVGRLISFPGQRIEEEFEIVGVAGDVRYEDARTIDERMAYLPLEQSIDPIRDALIVARGNGEVSPVGAAIRDGVTTLMPGGFVPRIAVMSDRVEVSLTRERLLSILATFFGALALLLACIGLYGVMAMGVIRRTREIGIRMAIGAGKRSVVWTVLRDTLVMVLIGSAAGAAASFAAARFVRNQLFDVRPGDPFAIGVAILLLLIVAAIAAYLPARRAARVDPVIALRYE